jgi:hypothetical protein
LQQNSHGQLNTGHSRTGRHCRATQLEAEAATQDQQQLSQSKEQAHINNIGTPNPSMSTRCGTGTVAKQGTEAHKAAPSRPASPKLHTHDRRQKEATTLQHTFE